LGAGVVVIVGAAIYCCNCDNMLVVVIVDACVCDYLHHSWVVKEIDRKWGLDFIYVLRMNIMKQRVYNYTLVVVLLGVALALLLCPSRTFHFPRTNTNACKNAATSTAGAQSGSK